MESSGDDLRKEEINFLSFLHVMRKVHHGVSHWETHGELVITGQTGDVQSV